ncbi:MAG: N-acetylmuramoyl-L-alanine amidase family protein [Eubacterium sp.]|nr:N-acetylmuramoyl-L-alanine amidase family protein [Eubacterium sp.]
MAWKKNGNNWNYLNSDGSKKTGWVQDKGKWYYLDKNGNMKTGWVQSGGKWYYMNTNGDMRTGWVKDKGEWYYLNSDGAMATGAKIIDGKTYGFDNSGKMTFEDQPFKYNGTLESQSKSAMAAYNRWADYPEANGYNRYITDVNDLYDQVMNAERFSYDPQQDALFQMYKQQYNAQGTRAMNNQMGVGTALSGGYNSSAAQTAAQSTYQSYLDQLNEKAADTYQDALSRYQYDNQQRLNRYNTALDMNNAANDAYWAQLSARQQRANMAYNAFTDDRNNQYTQYSDNRNYWLQQAQNNQSQANWQKEYSQTESWNKKNYELNKKAYTG